LHKLKLHEQDILYSESYKCIITNAINTFSARNCRVEYRKKNETAPRW